MESYYVRLSLMNPKPGREEVVSRIMDDMLRFYKSRDGYVRGYKLTSGDPQGRAGRLSVWRSEHDCDQAAQTQHILAIRSELNQMIEEDSHVERSYTAYEAG
jgi:quinol monooxygenase YgiN